MNLKRCNGHAYLSQVTVKLGKHSITITGNLLLLLICVMLALIKNVSLHQARTVFHIYLPPLQYFTSH